MKTYGKSILALLGGLVLTVLPMLSGDHHIDADEAVAIVIAAAQLAGVWLVPLAPQAKWAKTAVAFVLTIAQVLSTLILGGIDLQDVGVLVTAVLTFFGVAYAGAVSPTPASVPDVVAKTGIGDS